MKTILYFLTMWLLIIPAPAVLAAHTAPDALVKSTVDEVMAVIKQNKDKQALRALAEQKVLPYFDFKHIHGEGSRQTADSDRLPHGKIGRWLEGF